MPSERADRMDRLFRAALLHPPDEQRAFLDAACPDDADLRDEIASLLQADRAAERDEFLDTPPALPDVLVAEETEVGYVEGDHIARYRIIRLLARGGMGEVYLAAREEPFRQYVALKVIRRGMDSAEVLRRFEMERQILASLSHPNIARLLDGGVSDAGLSYFAMEYVEGQPITEWLDTRTVDIDGRLRLFQTVCSAVHHAHQNLIVHRDLKPSNIFVTNDGIVKLLDFGIAKLLNPTLARVGGPETRYEMRMLTPTYASPEQTRGEPLTTASDIYSLGVILYEILAGSPPFPAAAISHAEMIRLLSEVDPERPSQRVSHGEGGLDSDTRPSLDAIARGRATTGDRLRRRLRRDLDTIVMMALRKEPSRRYPSAEEMSADIERQLKGLPVVAHKDSAGYRIGKFVRRRRFETAAAAIVVVMLLFFALFSLRQASETAEQRDRARSEAERAEKMADFALSLFNAADPLEHPADTLTPRTFLDAGIQRIRTELADQPIERARMTIAVANAYRTLAINDSAARLVAESIDLLRRTPDAPRQELGEAVFILGNIEEMRGNLDKSLALYREYLDIQESITGKQHPHYLLGLYHLAAILHIKHPEEGERVLREWELLTGATWNVDDPDLAESMGSLADMQLVRGEKAKAERTMRRALEIYQRLYGPRDYHVASLLNRLGWILIAQGRHVDAEKSARGSLDIYRVIHPMGHRNVAEALMTLGESLINQGRYREALDPLRENLDLRIRLYGERHYLAARAFMLMGRVHAKLGNRADALRYMAKGVDLYREVVGPDSPITKRNEMEMDSVVRR